jgi:hypothetical protein
MIQDIEKLSEVAQQLARAIESLSFVVDEKLQALSDEIHDLTKTHTKDMSKVNKYMEEIAASTGAIANSFYYTEEDGAGSIYHLAGSVNSIKLAMPNYRPKKAKFGKVSRGRKNKDMEPEAVIDQQL